MYNYIAALFVSVCWFLAKDLTNFDQPFMKLCKRTDAKLSRKLCIIWPNPLKSLFEIYLTHTDVRSQKVSKGLLYTPSIPEIIWAKNVRAIAVCGFLMKSLKKHILKIWKKSWVPFGSYLLNSTANPAHFHSNWAESAVLFSR